MLIDSTPQRPNSQSTINKLLQKDLKELVFSLDSNQLISLFKNLQIETQTASSKEFTKIGLKCSECHTVFENFQSKGYGRDEHEALINSIRIILESMISSSYRVESIKKALRYCSKFKQPLINSSQGNSLLSSTKKSMKKVQGLETTKMTKKHLEYGQESANKENMSKRINQIMDLNAKSIEEKLNFDSQKFQKAIEGRPSSPIDQSKTQSRSETIQNKCAQVQKGKDCIYFEMHKHSEKEIKSLNARIKLLEEENSMLKELLLKDFNKEFFKRERQEQNVKA